MSLLEKNFFDLFELPLSLSLDVDTLEKTYKRLQRLTHPDRFAAKSDLEKKLAIQMSSRINQAYTVLKDPVKRAVYFFELQGIATDFEKNTVMNSEFLMKQMAWREAMYHQPDVVKIEVQTEFNQTYALLSELKAQDAEAIVAKLSALKFYQKLLQELGV